LRLKGSRLVFGGETYLEAAASLCQTASVSHPAHARMLIKPAGLPKGVPDGLHFTNKTTGQEPAATSVSISRANSAGSGALKLKCSWVSGWQKPRRSA